MSKLYIKHNSKNPKDTVVMLNNQPLQRLKSLTLEMDAAEKDIVHLSFYPSTVEVKADVAEVKKETIEVEEPKKKPKKMTKKKGGE